MTESEWLSGTHPGPLLELVRSAGNPRKSRLLACACCRRIWDLLYHPASRTAVGVAERFADGLASDAERAVAFTEAVREAAGWTNCCGAIDAAISFASSAAAFAAADAARMEEEVAAAGDRVGDVLTMAEVQHPEFWPAPLSVAVLDASKAASAAAYGWVMAQSPDGGDGPESRQDWETAAISGGGRRALTIGSTGDRATEDYEVRVRARVQEVEEGWQCEIIRDVFGNPFRPFAINPTWTTETVIALASGIYADRAFDRMPILADALEEAGSNDADILTHCRGEGPHVRGCWVVDALLGKS